MKKLSLAAVAAALLAAPALALLVSGFTYGNWDLPNGAGSGFATGGLYDSSGNGIFKMEAKLVESPSPILSWRQGKMIGHLDDGNAALFPAYSVSGKWHAKALSGDGHFEAAIYKQVSPLGPVVLVGKMAGVFADPPSFPNKIGRYKGEWKADI